ncbi:hypothetical protein ACF0H5_024295 [Mactra antiquata]
MTSLSNPFNPKIDLADKYDDVEGVEEFLFTIDFEGLRPTFIGSCWLKTSQCIIFIPFRMTFSLHTDEAISMKLEYEPLFHQKIINVLKNVEVRSHRIG